ncbi:MAG TPA: PIN domain-containing protein [Ktedonobacterales bacterium]
MPRSRSTNRERGTELTDIFYISRRQVGIAQAHAAVQRCLAQFGIIAVNRPLLTIVAALLGRDSEDNVQIACAQHAALDLIVTRDPAGFHDAPMPVVEPAEAARRAAP